MRAAPLIRIVAALLATTATLRVRAEVRLDEGPPTQPLEVEIIATDRGPWTPTGTSTTDILNPDGDLLGDSLPGWVGDTQDVLAAWTRGTSGSLEQAVGTRSGWVQLTGIAEPGAVGQPVVNAVREGWFVTWQRVDGLDLKTRITATWPTDGSLEPVTASRGLLVATLPAGDSIYVLAWEPDTGYLTSTQVMLEFVPTQPFPIGMVVGNPVTLGNIGQKGGMLAGVLGECATCAGLEVHVTADLSRTLGVVTWWQSPTVLRYVPFGSTGPRLPAGALSAKLSSQLHPRRLIDDAIRASMQLSW